MNGRAIIEALHSGRRIYSSAIVAMSPLWPALAKQAGIDFVFVDTDVADLDDLKVQLRARDLGKRLGEQPVHRALAQAANDDGDFGGHF